MSTVHMQIEVVQGVVRTLQRLLQDMNSQVTDLAGAAPTGWWQGPAAEEYEQRLRLVRSQCRQMLQTGDDLVRQLEREWQEWQAAAAKLEGGVGIAAAGVVAGAGAGIAGGAVGGGGDAESEGTPPQDGSSEGGEAPPSSTYTPRFDGSTPAPGMDSTYGKPGQVPLDAVVKSTPDNRDPNLYADVINQFAVGNNPRYAHDPRWPNETYCNTFAGDVARAMGHPFPTKAEWGLNPRDRATIGMPDLWRYFTDPKAPIRATEQGWKEITVSNLEELEQYVNSGKMAVVLTPGHVGVVRPNQNITDLANIRIAQAGATNANDIPLVQGFGQQRLGQIRIFVHE